jgi:ABC-type oligopeptide transport system substrate-binding subunit
MSPRPDHGSSEIASFSTQLMGAVVAGEMPTTALGVEALDDRTLKVLMSII